MDYVIIRLFDDVPSAVAYTLYPMEGVTIINSNDVSSCSDFEEDCSDKEMPYRMMVVLLTFDRDEFEASGVKAEMLAEIWEEAFQITMGYQIGRSLSVTVPKPDFLHLISPDEDKLCLKIIATIRRGDEIAVDAETLSKDISKTIKKPRVQKESILLVEEAESVDSDKICTGKFKCFLPIYNQMLMDIKDKTSPAYLDKLKTKLLTEII